MYVLLLIVAVSISGMYFKIVSYFVNSLFISINYANLIGITFIFIYFVLIVSITLVIIKN